MVVADNADKVLVIAEAGVNHNGSIDLALKLVEAASAAGADIVKFQTFKADRLASRQARQAAYQATNTGRAESQLDMLRRLELSEDAHERIIAHCAKCNIRFLSTPFDFESLDLLTQRRWVDRIKLGSGELTNAPLLLAAARTGLPMIVSTGMATLGEVEAALGVVAFGYAAGSASPGRAAFAAAYADSDARRLLAERVTLLHCTTEYPAPVAEVNLRAMDTLRSAFGLATGFSDHTPGTAIAIAAAARGAALVEKHFTLDRTMEGPDHKASLEVAELRAMIEAIRQVEAALGDGIKGPAPSERNNMSVARKSLVAAARIEAGERLSEANITVKRPGNGLSPFAYWDIVGHPARRDYESDDLLAEWPSSK